uniref:VWFD domain-containing protein n=1 Tax=Cyprinus carpio carpio TaxID=630221 RepID=A0A9J8BRG4_CYPCA
MQENLISIYFFIRFEGRCSNSDRHMKKERKACCMARNLITSALTARLCRKRSRVDGLWFYLPFDHHDGRVKVRQSGYAALLETDFGLRVSFIWGWRVDLHLPSSYYGVVCGLCGNFNGNGGDELRDPAGNLLPSLYQWAKSWRAEDSVTSVCHDGCETDCPVCPPDQRALYETDAFCGVLTSIGQNVFGACHAKVNPQAFQQSCVYDLCFNNGDQKLLCQALDTYVHQCRQEGVIITDWRERFNCCKFA